MVPQAFFFENISIGLLVFQPMQAYFAKIFRNKYGDIVDEFHKTIPYVTRFEKARILGLRAKQLNASPSLARVEVDREIIDGYKIAVEEYKQKKIPFIVKRPIPNGTCEYWKFADLEQI